MDVPLISFSLDNGGSTAVPSLYVLLSMPHPYLDLAELALDPAVLLLLSLKLVTSDRVSSAMILGEANQTHSHITYMERDIFEVNYIHR